jgi:hypothetical protein
MKRLWTLHIAFIPTHWNGEERQGLGLSVKVSRRWIRSNETVIVSHMHTHIQTHAHTQTHIITCPHTHTHTHAHTNTYINSQSHTHTHTHTNIHRLSHSHPVTPPHTHTQTPTPTCWNVIIASSKRLAVAGPTPFGAAYSINDFPPSSLLCLWVVLYR